MRFDWIIVLALVAAAGCDAGRERELEAKRAVLEAERQELREAQARFEAEKRAAERRDGIKVNLPAGASLEVDPAAVSLVIDIPVSGAVAVQGQRVDDEQLDRLLRTAFQ